MKIYTKLTILFVFFSLTGYSQITDNLKMVWSDDFNGNQLDATKWKPCPEWPRQGGSYWSNENYRLNGNGKLELKVTEKNGSVYCGAIRTRGLFQKKYGYYEVKCKVPQMRGGWAAFWMMPMSNLPGNSGRDGTEIDIFESINGWNGKINHALHWDGYGTEHKKESSSISRPDLYDNQYHLFGVKWTPNEYIFYIDNKETWRSSAGGISNVEQYLKLTMEVSSDSWAGNWSDQTTKPIYWLIDYVRVYDYEPIVNQTPKLTFTVLQNGQNYKTGETIKMHANVSGDISQIDEIRFVDQKNGVSNVSKTSTVTNETTYWHGWNTTNPGDYTLKAIAYKNGVYVTNVVVNITIQDEQNPLKLSFSTLENGQLYNIGDDVKMDINLSGNITEIDEIRFISDNNSNGSSSILKTSAVTTETTYKHTWVPTEAGNYILKANTFKNGTYVSTITANIIIQKVTLDPLALNYTTVKSGQTYQVNNKINMDIDISGDFSQVDQLKFYRQKSGEDFKILKTSAITNETTYKHAWIPSEIGNYILKVIAYKNGNYVLHKSVNIVVISTEPSLKLAFRIIKSGDTFNVKDEVKMHVDLTGDLSQADQLEFISQENGKNNIILKTSTITSETTYWNKWIPSEAGNYVLKVIAYKNDAYVTDVVANVSIETGIITDLENNSTNSKILVYPNPTNGILSLNIDSKFSFIVFDLSGSVRLKGENLMSNSLINLSDLAQGSYLLKVISKNENHFFNITKK